MQANLGMKRCKQCEELLALAAWLLYSEPEHALPLMKAQLNRLYGQLHALMGRSAPLTLTPQAFKRDFAATSTQGMGTQFVRLNTQLVNGNHHKATFVKLFSGHLIHCESVMGDSCEISTSIVMHQCEHMVLQHMRQSLATALAWCSTETVRPCKPLRRMLISAVWPTDP